MILINLSIIFKACMGTGGREGWAGWEGCVDTVVLVYTGVLEHTGVLELLCVVITLWLSGHVIDLLVQYFTILVQYYPILTTTS